MATDNSQSYSGVTPSQFNCIKTSGEHNKHPAIYDPADGDKGTVTIKTPVGTINLDFDYNSGAQTLTYTIVHKPRIITTGELWGGFKKTVDACAS